MSLLKLDDDALREREIEILLELARLGINPDHDTTDRYAEFQRRYYSDPVAFARECINWPAGSFLTGYQADIMAAVPVRRRVSAVGPHGLGKSAQSALLIL